MREAKHPTLDELAHRTPLKPRKPNTTDLEEAYELLGGPLGGVVFDPNAKPDWIVPKKGAFTT